mgnify:CR=1 FL=1
MKSIKTLFYLCIILLTITSCSNSDDDGEYKGKNELFLTVEGTNVLEDSEEGNLILSLMLTRASEQDIEIKLSLKNNEYNNVPITSFVESPVLIKAGEKKAQVTLKSNNKGILTSEQIIEIDLESTSDNNIKLNKSLLITVKPGAKSIVLTEEQLKLIEGYKQDGFDIKTWIGLIPVKVKIVYPGGASFAPFLDRYEKTVEGKTAITLSPNATADKIVLKMVHNAMGIENYLYDILRAETVLNTDFWMKQPAPEMTVKLIGLSESKAETFNLALDNLEMNKANSSISFISNNVKYNMFDDVITAVNFDYSFSAWDRLKKLIDEKNQDAIDANEQGGSVFPGYILNQSSIDSDNWNVGNNTWVKPSSSFDISTGEMKFIFNMDHTNANGYIAFEVTYSSIK